MRVGIHKKRKTKKQCDGHLNDLGTSLVESLHLRLQLLLDTREGLLGRSVGLLLTVELVSEVLVRGFHTV